MPDWIWVQNALIPILGMGIGVYFGTWVFRTINKVIDRKMTQGVAAGDLAELRAALEDVHAELREEISDLHERMDFAERAITSGRAGRPADVLEPPPHDARPRTPRP